MEFEISFYSLYVWNEYPNIFCQCILYWDFAVVFSNYFWLRLSSKYTRATNLCRHVMMLCFPVCCIIGILAWFRLLWLIKWKYWTGWRVFARYFEFWYTLIVGNEGNSWPSMNTRRKLIRYTNDSIQKLYWLCWKRVVYCGYQGYTYGLLTTMATIRIQYNSLVFKWYISCWNYNMPHMRLCVSIAQMQHVQR